jgi:cysteine sulfinate desulfinase/cysteine desulfurase-like protein
MRRYPEVVKAMSPFFTDAFRNPSATYSYGQEAKDAIEEAWFRVPELIRAEIYGDLIPACNEAHINKYLYEG